MEHCDNPLSYNNTDFEDLLDYLKLLETYDKI